MKRSRRFAEVGFFLVFTVFFAQIALATPFTVKTRSAIVIDTATGRVLFEQAADDPIAPASVTKIITLYILFDAVREGRIHLSDSVEVSRRAANTGGSRMGLKAGKHVPLEELIKGIAVVSGNDACVAAAEHLCGDVETFVRKMNMKARELGMTNTRFMTPNGLPAAGQVTTARDISKLSMAYLRRFPDALSIHSMQCYTYNSRTHHNANRLLGKCPGVDGIKTGFVCASGYNIAATAKRGDTRILAVVMGAPSPGIRAAETAKLLEAGFRQVAPEFADLKYADNSRTAVGSGRSGKSVSMTRTGKTRAARVTGNAKQVKRVNAGVQTRATKHSKVALRTKTTVQSKSSAQVSTAKTHGKAVWKKEAKEKKSTAAKTTKQAAKTPAAKQVAAAKKNSSSNEVPRNKKSVVKKSTTVKKSTVAQTRKPSKPAQKASNASVGNAQKPNTQAKVSKRKDQG